MLSGSMPIHEKFSGTVSGIHTRYVNVHRNSRRIREGYGVSEDSHSGFRAA